MIFESEHIVGLSGGKDSSALALRLREVEPRPYTYLITPTGDELPEMRDHWNRLADMLETPLTVVTAPGGTLSEQIAQQNCLPNHRIRWCTRKLKIEPCLAYMKARPGSVLYVGLRADEPERKGIYDSAITCRFPLREWGWGVGDVRGYLRERGVVIPERTDCARCYAQRKSEWERLYWNQPGIWQEAAGQEAATGHTFRYGESLERMASQFAARGRPFRQLSMFSGTDELDDSDISACRVCSL